MVKRVEILLIDDNPADIMFVRNHIIKHSSHITLNIVQNYSDAIDYFFKITSDDTHEKPQLILLEITISNSKGKQLLTTIKEHEDLKKIPLLILTNSKDSNFAQECYKRHANAHIRKPESKERFFALIDNILKFWMDTVSLPEFTWR
jgi:CheY-like chemotaxis protein